MALVKTGSLAEATAGTPAAGDVISYSFEATNTGNVTVSGIALEDGLAGLSEIVFGTWPGVAGSLAPGQTVTATADYALSQADLDNGAVYNAAVVKGLAVRGGAVLAEDDTTTVLIASPSLRFDKSGAAAAPERPLAGQSMLFSFVIENTGNITATGVAITDELAGLGDVVFDAWPAAVGVLAPGQRVTATAGYTLSQADVDAGLVENTAVVAASPVRGDAISVPATTAVPLAAAPSLTLVKSAALADANGDGLANPGEGISYSFAAENSGNVTLNEVVVDDAMVSGIPVIGTLAPGESATVSAELYTVLAEDAAAGEVENIATVSGRTPTGETVESDQSSVTVGAAVIPKEPTTPATTEAPTGLAITGFNSAGIGLASGLLLVTGLLFLQFNIRRRRARGQQ
jgi:uncharacterized repeat protein (TIGR01451 family)